MSTTKPLIQVPKSLQLELKALPAALWEKCPSIEFTKNISYLVISDIHLFHGLNKTEFILDNLEDLFDGFKPTSRFTGLDIIFIAGDIFDTLLYLKHPSVVRTLDFFRKLMKFCAIYGIALRILEGTPSHDYKQAASFQSTADAFGDSLDYKYVQSLSIERFPKLNLSVLYVPDEWGGSAKECHRQVEELLESHGLEQVDIGIMHGMFEYQLPEVGNDPLVHCSDYYLSIIKFYINIGHVHTASFYSRILAQGSFDRMKHGEEEKKGCIQVNLRLNGVHNFEFIENKGARVFKTIEVKIDDLDKAVAKLRKDLVNVPDNSFVRIRAPKGSPIFNVVDSFKVDYPTLTFKKDEQTDKVSKSDALSRLIDLDTAFAPVHLPKESIVAMTMEEVAKTNPMTAQETAELLEELTLLNI